MCYLLILLILLIALFVYDYKKDVTNKVIKFFGDKNIVKCSLYFIYIFPIAVSTIVVSISNIETKDVFSPIVSFYATALTITFTVYSFLKTQKATEDDRKEREDQREKERNEREDQREKERIERENKNFELREKELEAQKDHYRPIFVIEKDTNQVRLLMKNENLYLEHIVFYTYDNGKYVKGAEYHLKSNQLLNEKLDGSFFITAKTLIGETILFYFDYPDKTKHYYYLKPDKNPIKPLYRTSDIYTTTGLNEIWGTYNNIGDNESEKSLILQRAFPIRINLVIYPIHDKMDLYNVCYLEMFFCDIFSYLYNHTFEEKKYDEKLHKLLKRLIVILNNVKDYIQFTKNETKYDSFIQGLENHEIISRNKLSYRDLIDTSCILTIVTEYLNYSSQYTENSYEEYNPAKVSQFLEIIEEYLESLSHSDFNELEKVLQILMRAFKIIEFDEYIPNDNAYVKEAQSYLLEYLDYFTEDY